MWKYLHISTSKRNSFRGNYSWKYGNCIIFVYCFKVSHHVDHTGKIFMTYITSWSHPESNLLGLIQACRDAFGELPPVFSKVSSQTQPQQQYQTLPEAHHAAPQELLQNSRQQDHRVNNSVKIYSYFVVYLIVQLYIYDQNCWLYILILY